MARERPGSSSAEAPAAGGWEPFLDDEGNLYFYSHVTGESVWELPPEGDDERGQTPPAWRPPSKPHGHQPERTGDDSMGGSDGSTASSSSVSVAVGVVETVVNLVDAVDASPEKTAKQKTKGVEEKPKRLLSPAAESRRRKNDAKAQARRQRMRAVSTDKYLKLVLPAVSPNAGVGHAEGEAKPTSIGTLFSAQDSELWQREVEAERAMERRAVRRQRQQHKQRVRSLKQQQEMLRQLRTELATHLLSDVQCSPELLKHKILLLSSGTSPSALSSSRLEPEVAEKLATAERLVQEERVRAVEAAFELLDSAKCGKVRLVSVITGIFAHEAQMQQHCSVVKGLGELLASPRLQQFILGFASSRDHDCRVDSLEFRELIGIVEEVWDYYSRVKAAVDDAENEIDAAIEAATLRPGTGAARARMGFVSKKKAAHELAQLQERAALLQSMSPDASEERPWGDNESLIQPTEEWEKDHHHRFIRASPDARELFCCLCRRRRWELARHEADEAEQRLRDEWPKALEIRLKEAEVRLAGGSAVPDDTTGTTDVAERLAPASSVEGAREDAAVYRDFVSHKLATLTDDDEIAVLEVLHTLLVVVESIASESGEQRGKKPDARRRVHRRRNQKTGARSAFHTADPTTGLSAMQILEKALQAQELERRAMADEELAMRVELERFARRQERPHLRFQEAASDSYVRILERCVDLPPLLRHVRFERCLSRSSPQTMALLVVDSASPDAETPLVLYTLPHRRERDADLAFEQLRKLQQHLRSPFVASMRLVDKRSFHSFAESGMLVECWPMQFVAAEFFPQGSWLDNFRGWVHERRLGDANGYAHVEQHVLAVFRDVAAGIASMHSLGVLHLNVHAGNIFVCSDASDVSGVGLACALPTRVKVKVGGLLAWTAGYDVASLAQGDILEHMRVAYAPPEALDRRPITAKADVWMLGCAICDALLLWQHAQLAAAAPARSPPPPSPVVFSCTAVHDLLLMLPLATSAAARSLIRMLLQPEPAVRPDMSQVVEYISFAGVSRR